MAQNTSWNEISQNHVCDFMDASRITFRSSTKVKRKVSNELEILLSSKWNYTNLWLRLRFTCYWIKRDKCTIIRTRTEILGYLILRRIYFKQVHYRFHSWIWSAINFFPKLTILEFSMLITVSKEHHTTFRVR